MAGHQHLIDGEEIERIKERGCCLGKYRVLIDNSYYCFLEGIFACKNQDKRYVKNLNSNMAVCKTNQQLPCEQCELYKNQGRKNG
jgi:hypothetical protein